MKIRLELAALMAFALAACAVAAPASAPPVSASPAPTAAPPALRVLVARDPVAERLLGVAVRGFVGRHPAADIQVDYFEGDPGPRLKTLAAQGTPPDVIWATNDRLEALAGAGVLTDLQALARTNRDIDPSAFDPGCDCQRPPAPFRLENITSQALAASRVAGRTGLYMIPGARLDLPNRDTPSYGGFAVAASTSRLETAWAFVRYLATEDAQRAILNTYPGATVLRSLSGE